jgi:pyruvate dehydrogenase (quinone)
VPVVQVDIRGEQIGRRIAVRHPLVGTVKDTLTALHPLLRAKDVSERNHPGRMREHYTRARRELDKLAVADRERSPLHPQFVARTVSDVASDDAVFIPDVGSPIIWSARYLAMNGRRRLIGSFIHGSMANALPHAIGAQAASPGRQVVALSGDGGIAMLMGDLITLSQHRLPVKIVVFNNSALAFVELEMMAAGIPTFGTDLSNPDFAGVARALGIHGVRVERPGELRPALEQAFEHDGPHWWTWSRCDEVSVPPHVTLSQATGVFVGGAPGKPLLVTGWARRGHPQEALTRIVVELAAAASRISGVDEGHVMVVIQDSPARSAVEGGRVLPEPGHETEWLEHS